MERERNSLLIIDSDARRAERMRLALEDGGASAANRERAGGASWRCRLVRSLAELATENLGGHVMALCDMSLKDGTGIDALAYIRGAHPGLPVVLLCEEVNASLAMEATLAGAIDCLSRHDRLPQRLPAVLARCLALHEVVAERERMQKRLSQSVAQLADEVTQLQNMISNLEAAAVTDELTGVHNRRQLNMAIDQCWLRGERKGEAMAFLMIDVDRFKHLNDELGHQAGDALLRLLGRVLRENTRQTDVVARYGGDEFCVVMPHIGVEETLGIARRIADAFEQAAAGYPTSFGRVGLSIGVAHTLISRPSHAAQLVAQADEAMYHAKRQGVRVMARGETGLLAVENVPRGNATD